ncbi:type II toxin-antitoxin system RelE family toxin [Campylobacter helveticus]|uniref:type II toxin-antitoxin system RelE family toxin n=1 Tax=Campylobacter helveticus TaxID=28898 RepID=UPI0022EADBF1|nr:type II toxin-antitoxin system RelE/ParE family toxin [Campylobacter helveticus]
MLEKVENPKFLTNAKKLQGYDKDCYRWRIENYRIIGIVEDDELLITIIKISHRQGAYK